MSNANETKREVLTNKFSQAAQNFEEVKKEAFEPQIERLGQTKGQQKQRTQS